MKDILNEDLENVPSEQQIEGPPEELDRLGKLYKMLENQNNAILLLTGKMTDMTTGLKTLEEHQDTADTAIIEVAKKVGGGGGGGGGAGNLLAQILPYLKQDRGPSPLEKIANQMFIRNIAFTSLTTERLAKKQFGDEYARMVKDMESEMYGVKDTES
jgi:hypothetical protein